MLDDLEDGGEDGGAFSLWETTARSVEVASEDLKPEPDESSVNLLIVFEVGEGEMEDVVEERASCHLGREGREEGDEVVERERGE